VISAPAGFGSRLTIARAVRPGCRRARSQRSWLRAVARDDVIAALRADKRSSVMEFARIHARWANWSTLTSWRPRARVCKEIGSPRDRSKPLSVSAYKAARRVLEDRGFLGLVQAAWTSSLRAGALDDGGNTSAVFVLTVPGRRRRRRRDQASELNRPVSPSCNEGDKPSHACARETREGPVDNPRETPAAIPQPTLPAPGTWPLASIPRTSAEMLAAAQALAGRAPVLRRISPAYLRYLCRPFFAAGFSGRDVIEALNHDVTGRPYRWTGDVRHVPGWFRSRLAPWMAPDGSVRPSASQQRAAEAARVRAEQAARRAQDAAVRAAAASPERVAVHASRVREALLAARHARLHASGAPAVAA